MHDVSSESASDEFITLHVVTKNVQSLKHEDRFNDFVAATKSALFFARVEALCVQVLHKSPWSS